MTTEFTCPLPVGLETDLWERMPLNAQKALLSAETMLSLQPPELDHGLAVVGYFKAIEITLEDRIFGWFRHQMLAETQIEASASLSAYQEEIAPYRSQIMSALRGIIGDPKLQIERKLTLIEERIRLLEEMEKEYDQAYRLHSYVYLGKPLTLVGMAQILQYLKRVGDETRFGLLWSLKRFVKLHYAESHRFWSAKRQLAIRLEAAVLADRNPAAHVEVHSKERALMVRRKILGDRSQEGILVSILKVLA